MVLMRLVDIQLSFPAILIALILLAILGKGADKVVIALVSAQWAYYARTIRGSALVETRREYMEAARCLALPQSRIIIHHLLPNAFPPLIVVATVQVAHAIALEATLSFLGVGVPITEPSSGCSSPTATPACSASSGSPSTRASRCSSPSSPSTWSVTSCAT